MKFSSFSIHVEDRRKYSCTVADGVTLPLGLGWGRTRAKAISKSRNARIGRLHALGFATERGSRQRRHGLVKLVTDQGQSLKAAAAATGRVA